MQKRTLNGHRLCSHGAHGPDQKEALRLSKKLTPEAAAESPTFPKIADSWAQSQRRKLVENYEL